MREEIRAALIAHAGVRDLSPKAEADIFGSLRLAGDDASEFLDWMADRFGTDFSGFVAELHVNLNEPPIFRHWRAVGPDGRRLPDLPISLDDLARAARDGRWSYPYPPYSIQRPHARWHLADVALVAAVIVVAIALLLTLLPPPPNM